MGSSRLAAEVVISPSISQLNIVSPPSTSMDSNNARPLWSAETFMSSVPENLKQDPDILNMAEQFRIQLDNYHRLVEDVRDKEQQIKDCQALVRKIMGKRNEE